MELRSSAHVDTFARDHLPPPDQWPRAPLRPPELRYPDRLNCGAELLDGTVERLGADRPAFRDASGRGLDVRRAARAGRPRSPMCSPAELGVAPGQPRPAARPHHALAGRLLARRDEGGGGRGDRAGRAAPAGAAPRSARSRRCGTRCATSASVDDLAKAEVPGLRITTLRRGRAGRSAAARPARRRAVPGRGHRRRRCRADRLHLRHHRPPQGLYALPPRCARHRRHLLGAGAAPAARTTCSPAARRWASPSGSAAWSSSRCGPAPRPCSPTGAGPEQLLGDIARAPDLGAVHRADRLPRDAGQARRARRLLAAPVRLGRREPARRHLAGLARARPACGSSTASARPSCCTSSSPPPTRRSGPGRRGCRSRASQARVVDADGAPLPDGEPGLLAVRGPVGCRYLADAAPAEYVRGRLEPHRRHLRPRPRRLLPLCGPRRRHDHLGRATTSRAPRSRTRCCGTPMWPRRRWSGGPTRTRGQVVVAHVVLRAGRPPGRGHRRRAARLHQDPDSRRTSARARSSSTDVAAAHRRPASSSASGCGDPTLE